MSAPARIELAVPAATYHQRMLGQASKSTLDLLRRSPAHYRCYIDGQDEREETEAFAIGTAVHAAILEPELFALTYTERPDFGDLRTKVGKAARDEWLAENGDRESLAPDAWSRVLSMRDAVLAHPTAGPMLRGGHAEATAYWVDAETGVECKCRADYWRPDLRILVDLKTTEDASPEAFARSIARYGYQRQAAFYLAGFAAASGVPVDAFVFVAVEKRPPFAVGVYVLDEAAIALGEEGVRRDLQVLAECTEWDEWPAYDPAIQTITLPRWTAA